MKMDDQDRERERKREGRQRERGRAGGREREGERARAREREREGKDIKSITGMFELLQEEGLTTRKDGGSNSTPRPHPMLSSVVPEANSALVRSWEEPRSEHITPEDYNEKKKNHVGQP